jgi:preprotein translocase subunit SecD
MRLFCGSMKSRSVVFNTYFWSALAALLIGAGCATDPATYESKEDKPDKQLTSLRLHMQTIPDPTGRTLEVPVFRTRPVLVTIDKEPFITEGNVMTAEVLDEPGGFSIQITFERQGRWLLEKFTAANLKRRIAIYAAFGPDRWLAAPVVQQTITDGKLTFTPDATREEALRIVRGLKNYAKKMEHDPRF